MAQAERVDWVQLALLILVPVQMPILYFLSKAFPRAAERFRRGFMYTWVLGIVGWCLVVVMIVPIAWIKILAGVIGLAVLLRVKRIVQWLDPPSPSKP